MRRLLPFALAISAIAQEPFHGSIEVGHRAVGGIGGSQDAYRNAVNLGEGVRVMAASGDAVDLHRRAIDRISFAVSGWGGDPDTLARLSIEKQHLYVLTLSYRNLAYFNRLPTYGLGVESRDVRRRFSNVQLDLLPGRGWTPYLAWSADGGSGTSLSFFGVDANEYAVAGALRDRTDYFRGGVNGRLKSWTVTLEQGGSIFRQDDSESTRDRNLGNRTSPIGGQRLELDALDRQWRTRGDTLSSRAGIAGSPAEWIDLSGTFLYTQPSTTTAYGASATGRFIDLQSFSFSNRFLDLLPAEARQPHSSGTFSAEVRPMARLRIVESWSTDRFHSASPLSSRLVGNWSRQQLEGIADLAGGFTVRGGWRRIWGDALTRVPLLGGPGSGEIQSNAGLAGLSWRRGTRASASADYEGTAGDRVLYSVGIQDAHRLRIRGRVTPVDSLTFTSNLSWLDGRNAAGRGQAQTTSHLASVSAIWSPPAEKRWSMTASYARSSFYTETPFLIPQSLSPALSVYRENGHSISALAEWQGKRARLAAGGSMFVSSGSRPARYYEPQGRIAIPVAKGLSITSEWRWYALGEPFYVVEGFRSHVWTTGLIMSR